MPLSGKTAIVTGAAGAPGLACVRALLEDGAQVALLDLDALRLDSLIRFLRGSVMAVPCDVTSPEAVRQAEQQVAKLFGTVEILVNAADVHSTARLEAAGDEEWRSVMAVNVDGAFHCARAVIPGMRKKGWGRIVNLGSIDAKTGGLASGTAYAVSKGALASLTFALARELAGSGITVNAVAAACLKTPRVTEQMNDAQRRQLLSQIPLGRFCETEELAHAVRFLASPLAGFVTGEIVDVNGGLLMD